MGSIRPDKRPVGMAAGGVAGISKARQAINLPRTNWASKKAINRTPTRYDKSVKLL
jgi:hypothetical protein